MEIRRSPWHWTGTRKIKPKAKRITKKQRKNNKHEFSCLFFSFKLGCLAGLLTTAADDCPAHKLSSQGEARGGKGQSVPYIISPRDRPGNYCFVAFLVFFLTASAPLSRTHYTNFVLGVDSIRSRYCACTPVSTKWPKLKTIVEQTQPKLSVPTELQVGYLPIQTFGGSKSSKSSKLLVSPCL